MPQGIPATGRYSTRSELVAAVVDMWSKHRNYKEIAARTGASVQTVQGILCLHAPSKEFYQHVRHAEFVRLKQRYLSGRLAGEVAET